MSEEKQLRRDGGSVGNPLKLKEFPPLLPENVHPSRSAAEAARIRDSFHRTHGDKVDLFVYGTMMNDQHVRLLLNRRVESEPAVLHNYMRVVPPGAFYFVVKQHGATAQGRLLKGLAPEEIARLDAFEDEGNLYFRRVVVVRNQENRRRRCMTYVGNIPALQRSFGKEILFEDRYSLYLEKRSARRSKRSIPTVAKSRAAPSANSWGPPWTR